STGQFSNELFLTLFLESYRPPPAPKKPQVQKAVAKPAPAPAPKTNPAPVHRPAPAVGYQNCVDVWNKLGRSIYPRDAGFQSKFDRDGDGVGCERDPR